MREASGLKTLYVSTSKMLGTTATWTQTYASDRLIYSCDAGDQVSQLIVPVEVDLLNDDTVGSLYPADAQIEKIELEYNIAAEALDAAVTAEVQSQARAVDGVAPAVTSLACTVAADGGVIATTAIDDHIITITPDAALTLNGTNALNLEVNFDQATSTTVIVYGARIYYRTNLS